MNKKWKTTKKYERICMIAVDTGLMPVYKIILSLLNED
jgi:hypothetical protein